MTKLSKALKRMLTGLAYQDAGDYLSTYEKTRVLAPGDGPETRTTATITPHKIKTPSAKKRIAFISNGKGIGSPLNYAINACLRQNVQIDLLIHGAADTESITALENKIINTGIDYQQIQLKTNAVDGIIEYISQHPSLIYLIAMPDDDVVRTLIEDALPKYKKRMQPPIVLIEDQIASGLYKQSAA